MRSSPTICTALLALALAPAAAGKPDVLFIVFDDLNDWVGPLGGHPQARTPNIDRLAARGLTFTNAHVTAPLCNPSSHERRNLRASPPKTNVEPIAFRWR